MQRLLEPLATQRKRFPGICGCIGIALAIILLIGATVVTTLALAKGFIVPSGPVVVLPNSSRVLLEIRNMNRLETVSYSLERVYTDDKNANSPWYDVWKIFGDQRKLFVVPGEVIAGVDLTQLKQGDVQIQGKAITITLPPSQILQTSHGPPNARPSASCCKGFVTQGCLR
jgi:Protein of unknown function (DUF4230)